MKIRFISNDNGVGLTNDYKILKDIFQDQDVSYVHWKHDGALDMVDVQIFLELVNYKLMKYSRRNYLMPNPEWFYGEWIPHVHLATGILCKTHDTENVFLALLPKSKVLYTGFTSRDIYRPDVERINEFAHFAGKSSMKGTNEVVQAFMDKRMKHLKLTIFYHGHEVKMPAEAFKSKNIRLIDRRMNDEEFFQEFNRYQFHICPSYYEGFGHYINEARSVGAIILTTNYGPMSEVAGDFAFKCGTTFSHRHMLGNLVRPIPESITDLCLLINDLDEYQIGSLSMLTRQKYAEDKKRFTNNIRQIILG